jgi:hypothetical protein
LDDVVWRWRLDRPRTEDPEAWYEPLVEALQEYADALADDATARRLIDDALDSISRAKENDWSEYDEPKPSPRESWHSPLTRQQQGLGDRSIFDDIDGE